MPGREKKKKERNLPPADVEATTRLNSVVLNKNYKSQNNNLKPPKKVKPNLVAVLSLFVETGIRVCFVRGLTTKYRTD